MGVLDEAFLQAALKLSGIALSDTSQEGVELVCKHLMESLAGSNTLSIDQLAWGLYLLAHKHKKEGVKDALVGHEFDQISALEDFLWDLSWAAAAYETDMDQMIQVVGRDVEVVTRVAGSVEHAAYTLALDHSKQCVVLAIRGTSDFSDVLIDLTAGSEEVAVGSGELGHHCHAGMLRSAEWILAHEVDAMLALMTQHSDYQLKVVGHSLGAGTAAVLTMLLHMSAMYTSLIPPEKRAMISCTGLATPACMSYDLAQDCLPFISSIVLEDDVVPRMSLINAFKLQRECFETDWQKDIPEGTLKQDLLIAMNSAQKVYLSSKPKMLEMSEAVSVKLTKAASKGGSHAKAALVRGASLIQDYKPMTPVGAALKSGGSSAVKGGKSALSRGFSLTKGALQKVNSSVGGKNEAEDGTEDGVAECADVLPAVPPESPDANSEYPLQGPAQISLFAPGTLFHLRRVEGGDISMIQGCAGVCFDRICISKTMLNDHLLIPYEKALKQKITQLASSIS